jgi:hypothetical protein
VSRPQIRIATRARDTDWILEGEELEDSDIIGPAVLFNMGGVAYEHCTLEGAVQHAFWVAPEHPIIGVMGIRDCTFRRCTFRGVGFVGAPDDMVSARQAWSGES